MKKTLISMLFISSCLFMGSLFAGIDDGLVAYYPFDGNAYDASGNGNDGVENGSIEYVDGVVKGAIKLDGTTSYVRIANPDQKFDTQYSIAMWVHKEEGEAGALFSKYRYKGSPTPPIHGPDKRAEGFSLSFNASTPTNNASIGSHLFNAVFFNSVVDENIMSEKFPNFLYESGSFQHVVSTYDNGVMRLYENGVLRDEKIIDHLATMDNPQDILVGNIFYLNWGVHPSPAWYFSGLVDDLRIYNRTLSEKEVEDLFEGNSTCDKITDLIAQVAALEIHSGIKNSLIVPLGTALSACEDQRYKAVSGKLNAFINAVKSQIGKKIDSLDANDLIDSANEIIDLLQ